MLLYRFFFLLIIAVLTQAGIHQCVHASRKLSKYGNGTTPESCMMCDPTYATCPVGCQKLVDALYANCQGVCLPDGYFFDPSTNQYIAILSYIMSLCLIFVYYRVVLSWLLD